MADANSAQQCKPYPSSEHETKPKPPPASDKLLQAARLEELFPEPEIQQLIAEVHADLAETRRFVATMEADLRKERLRVQTSSR
jgi:hypothetical protein